MKTTSFLALALVAIGMSAQASPAPAPAKDAAAAMGSATIQRVDPGCYYKCRREGHVDCDWLCRIPDTGIPMAAASAKPALAKRDDYQCYVGCTAGCHDDDHKCMDRCALACVGSGRPPRKQ